MRKTCLVALAVLFAITGFAVAEDVDYKDPVVTKDSRTLPEYPPAALAAGYEGVVTVAALVNADGSLGVAEVIESTTPGLGFEESAVDAIKRWQFNPAQLNGEYVDSVGAFVFRFQSSGRINPTTYVGSQFLMSTVFDAAFFGKNPGFDKDAGFSPAVSIKDYLKKVKLPPEQLGAMYDRTTLVPKPEREIGGPVAPVTK